MPSEAFVYITKHIIESKFFSELTNLCKSRNIRPIIRTDIQGYVDNIKNNDNIITWGVKLLKNHYDNKNVLFLENGLLKQSAALYCDIRGYHTESTYYIKQKTRDKPTPQEKQNLRTKFKQRFKTDLFSEGNKVGPTIIALQMDNDATVRHHFPHRRRNETASETLLKICREYITDKNTIIRPHPKVQTIEQLTKLSKLCPKHWQWNDKEDIYKLISGAKCLITINSTLATEAAAFGVPVATLGEGLFTGTGATLECNKDLTRLTEITNRPFDATAAEKYLCCIIKYEIPYNAQQDDVIQHWAIRQWLDNSARLEHKIKRQPDPYMTKLKGLQEYMKSKNG